MVDFTLLIAGGSVYDASQSLVGAAVDIGISGNVITEVTANIAPARASNVYDATGKIVCAGLVDAMAHSWVRNPMGVVPDTLALEGVTTTCSPGDAGAGSVASFREQVVNTTSARVYCEVMISRWGYDRWPLSEIYPDISCINADDVAWSCIENADIVPGIKIRLSEAIIGSVDPQDIMDKAFAARSKAELETGKLFYIRTHIGALPTNTLLASIVSQMRAGDIIAHCYDGNANSSGVATGFAQAWEVTDAAYIAKSNGIILDVGAGGVPGVSGGSLDWLTTGICMVPLGHAAPGIRPDTLSSDTHAGSGGHQKLIDLGSAFLALNNPSNIDHANFSGITSLSPAITLDKVIEWMTWAPAKVINRDQMLGTLKVGARADVAILSLLTGSYVWQDTFLRNLSGTQRLEVNKVIMNGVVL